MTQKSFSRLFGDRYESDAAAKAARDSAYREAKKAGHKAYRSVLKGQLRQYWGFNEPCGEVCDVYMLTIVEAR